MDAAAGSDAEEHGDEDIERHPAGFQGPASEVWASLAGKRDGRKRFFFEKKNQKTFSRLVRATGGRPRSKWEKFFASFFQKRSASFSLAYDPIVS
jgi:hypothetical protein